MDFLVIYTTTALGHYESCAVLQKVFHGHLMGSLWASRDDTDGLFVYWFMVKSLDGIKWIAKCQTQSIIEAEVQSH